MAQDDTARLIKLMLQIRMSRAERFLKDIFVGGVPWDMILALFLADARGERLTARQVIDQTGGAVGAGERWMTYLNRQGLVAGDGNGKLDDVVMPTAAALEAVEAWVGTVVPPLRDLLARGSDNPRT